MTIKPGSYNLTIYQGATLGRVFAWKDESGVAVNLAGYTARMKARANIDSTEAFIDLTTENGGIVLGGGAGTVTLSMSAAATAALATLSGVYDLELIAGSTVIRLLQGSLTVSREVTR